MFSLNLSQKAGMRTKNAYDYKETQRQPSSTTGPHVTIDQNFNEISYDGISEELDSKKMLHELLFG